MDISEIQPTLDVYRPNDGPRTFEYDTTVEKWTEFVKEKDERNPFDKIIFIVHGFMTDAHAKWMIQMKDMLYAESSKKVVVIVGWGKGAYFGGSVTEYLNAIKNMEKVGKWLAPYVKAMKQGCPDNFVHAIGHSLGAHLVGFAGRNSDDSFDRITGLDPAGPWFEEIQHEKMLRKTDCKGMVDVIHTDGLLDVQLCKEIAKPEQSSIEKVVSLVHELLPDFDGVVEFAVEKVHLGTLIPMGNLDFYPNFGVSPQPGTVLKTSTPTTQSHSRAHEFFTWSIQHPRAFKARAVLKVRPTSDGVAKETDEAREEAQMGYFADQSEARDGNYYLHTRAESPWE